MNVFLEVMSYPATIRLGWALVHFMWQGLIIGGILEFALAVVGRKNASLRYVFCAMALMAMPLCLLATWWTLGETTHSTSALLVSRDDDGAIFHGPGPLHADSSPIVLPALTGIVLHEEWSSRLNRWMPGIVCGWLIGVALLAARKAGGLWILWRLHRQGVMVPDDALRHLFGQACQRIGLDPRRVQLKVSALVRVPLTMGWLRPVVLFPATLLTGLGATEIELLLAHELAHIRRHDYLVNLVQSVVETLFFYHPVMWWISRRMRQERESACDQMVTAGSFEVAAYAKALLRLEAIREHQPLLAPSAAGGSLLLRVERLAGEPERAAGWSGIVLLAMTVLIALAFTLSTLKLNGNAVVTGVTALPTPIHSWPVPNFKKTLGYPLAVTGEVFPSTDPAVNDRINLLTLHELNVRNMPLQDFMREIAKSLKQEHPDMTLMSTELMVPTPNRPYLITYRLNHPASVRQILAEVSRSYPLRFQFRDNANDLIVFQLSEFEQAFDEKAHNTLINLDLHDVSLIEAVKAIVAAATTEGFKFEINRYYNLARYASEPNAGITLQRKDVSVFDALCHVLVTGGLELAMSDGKYMFVPTGENFPMVDPLAMPSAGHVSAVANSPATSRGTVDAARPLPVIKTVFSPVSITETKEFVGDVGRLYHAMVYTQTSVDPSQLTPISWQFIADMANNAFPVTGGTVSLPPASAWPVSPVTVVKPGQLVGAHYLYVQGFKSKAELLASFPNGRYAFNIQPGSPESAYSVPVAFTETVPYPPIAPVITNTTWNSGALVLNPQSAIINFTNYPGATLTWEIVIPGKTYIMSAGGGGTSGGSLDLRGLLSFGQTYVAQLRFINRDRSSTASDPAAPKDYGYATMMARIVEFKIKTPAQ